MHWAWFEPIGYVGSLLMFATFFMKTMARLRVTAIAANCVMIAYTALAGVVPVLILQSCLLPLNILRFVQLRRLHARVLDAMRGGLDIVPLLPFMTREVRKSGDVLFRAGDRGDRMYYLARGRVALTEPGIALETGAIFGEISLFSPANERTATAACDGDCELYSVTQDVVLQLFYQRPEFGFFLMRLVTSRST
nr:cyclic nucleotide-binding domain-containing protein [Kofleriaceae bacterium]